MNTKELLQRARPFIEKGWTQDTMARDKRGLSVPFQSSRAVCWCLQGAMFVQTEHGASVDDICAALSFLAKLLPVERKNGDTPSTQVARFNDHIIKSKEEALEWLDRAIAKETENETQ